MTLSADPDERPSEATRETPRASDTEPDGARDVEPVDTPGREEADTALPLDDDHPAYPAGERGV